VSRLQKAAAVEKHGDEDEIQMNQNQGPGISYVLCGHHTLHLQECRL